MREFAEPNRDFLEMTAELVGDESSEFHELSSDESEIAYKKLHDFALAQYEQDLTDAPEDRLTPAFRIDMFEALRVGKPVLETLRKQGYLVQASHMNILEQDLAYWLHRGSLIAVNESSLPAELVEPTLKVTLPTDPQVAAETLVTYLPDRGSDVLAASRYPGGNCEGLDWQDMIPDNGGMTPEADGACAACPVRAQCAAYGRDNPDSRGILGGLTEKQRSGRTGPESQQPMYEIAPKVFVDEQGLFDPLVRSIWPGVSAYIQEHLPHRVFTAEDHADTEDTTEYLLEDSVAA